MDPAFGGTAVRSISRIFCRIYRSSSRAERRIGAPRLSAYWCSDRGPLPTELAAMITEQITIPTIGIGAGPHCDGQVLVFHDVLGIYDGHKPKFVRQYAHIAQD